MLIVFGMGTSYVALYALVIFCCRAGATLGFGFAYCIHIDLFPPSFVVSSIGLCNFVCRGITILAPILCEVENKLIPLMTMLAFNFVAVLATTLLRKDEVRIMKRKNTSKFVSS